MSCLRGRPRSPSLPPACGRGKTPQMRAEKETGSPAATHPPKDEAGRPQHGKKFVYVEPSRRVKEILEEELYFRKEECHIKHPAAVALEGIWSVKKNFSMGGLKPASQNRNSLLLQPKFYSRHEGMKSKSQ
nr:PREDICTED: uncharacterized protein LOC104154013 [Struthio camelus australis]